MLNLTVEKIKDGKIMKNEILDKLTVIKRNGKKVTFDGSKIALAIKKGFDNITVIKDDDAVKVYYEIDI